jgi:hypothetical protein
MRNQAQAENLEQFLHDIFSRKTDHPGTGNDLVRVSKIRQIALANVFLTESECQLFARFIALKRLTIETVKVNFPPVTDGYHIPYVVLGNASIQTHSVNIWRKCAWVLIHELGHIVGGYGHGERFARGCEKVYDAYLEWAGEKEPVKAPVKAKKVTKRQAVLDLILSGASFWATGMKRTAKAKARAMGNGYTICSHPDCATIIEKKSPWLCAYHATKKGKVNTDTARKWACNKCGKAFQTVGNGVTTRCHECFGIVTEIQ